MTKKTFIWGLAYSFPAGRRQAWCWTGSLELPSDSEVAEVEGGEAHHETGPGMNF